jgi:tetratricopeptide (TPR) repeat protein
VLHVWSPECERCLAELEEWSRARQEAAAGHSLPVHAATLILGSEGPELGARVDRVRLLAERFGFRPLLLGREGALALGVLVEDLVHWPREIPLPATFLVDGAGRLVKLYRGAVAWPRLAADARAIPATPAARLVAALPFAGEYYFTDLSRNGFQLGISYQEVGLLEHAAVAFRQSLERRPLEPDTLFNLALLESRRGARGAARELYRKALSLEPDFADARANLGVLMAEDGELDGAAEEFRRVLGVRPDHVEALLNLGNVELERG